MRVRTIAFQLVRSKNKPPGEPIDRIATRRQYERSGVRSCFIFLGSGFDPEVKSPKKPYFQQLMKRVICVDVIFFMMKI